MNVYSLGYTYNLSKRTNLYAMARTPPTSPSPTA